MNNPFPNRAVYYRGRAAFLAEHGAGEPGRMTEIDNLYHQASVLGHGLQWKKLSLSMSFLMSYLLVTREGAKRHTLQEEGLAQVRRLLKLDQLATSCAMLEDSPYTLRLQYFGDDQLNAPTVDMQVVFSEPGYFGIPDEEDIANALVHSRIRVRGERDAVNALEVGWLLAIKNYVDEVKNNLAPDVRDAFYSVYSNSPGEGRIR